MGVVNTTYTFSGTDTITSSKLNNIIDDTTFTSDAIQGNTLQVVSPGKLAVNAGGITSNEMGSNSVVTAAITDSNVTTAKIADANVTQAKLGANVTTTGPAFHVNMGETNQFVPNTGVNQIIQFDNEVFDVGSCFNTSNYRFTPNVAGYYQINLSVQLNHNNSGSLGNTFSAIRKNGLFYDIGITSMGATAFQLSDMLMSGSVLLYMNGTTDYIDATSAISFATTTNAVIVGSYGRTYMSGFLARSA
jgi:hypothetical protein